MAIRILIADDHEVFRVGLSYWLEKHRDVEIIGALSNGEELLNALQFKTPDIVLLDLNMPNMDGMKALQKITKLNQTLKKSIRVIIVSAHDSESYITETIEEGACGFLSKNSQAEEILMAIDSVYENGFYFNEKINKALLNRLVKKGKLHPVFDKDSVALNPTELSVLKLVCQEKTSAEIAEELFLSKRSIEDVRTDLHKKIGVRNAVGLALWAYKNNLINY